MRRALTIILLLASVSGWAQAVQPDYRIYQFPRNAKPSIDGDFADWDQVPEDYMIGTEFLKDDSGKYSSPCPETLDVKVKVGWVKGENRLYFYYEAFDNYWDFARHSIKNDTFEIVVDGDLSGGPHVAPLRPDPDKISAAEYFFTRQNCHAQNYHVMTPSQSWKSWAMVWGPQQWLKQKPFSDCAYSYDFRPGESGVLKMEFYITVYDYAAPEGPSASRESKLRQGRQIGLSWAIIDHDGAPSKDGFWNLSDDHRMYGDASFERRFTLCPPEKGVRNKTSGSTMTSASDSSVQPVPSSTPSAAFTIRVDKGSRTAHFTDQSSGEINSWLWEFGDGQTSTEKNPSHSYEGTRQQFTATLTVRGPAGESVCCKVREVMVW